MKKTIMVVDDSANIRKIVKLTFENMHEVIAAENGEEALNLIQNTPPDLFLIDANMPGMSGYELCQKIRDVAEYQFIPLILMIGTFDTYDEELGDKAKYDLIISKPFESDYIVKTVQEELEKAEQRKSSGVLTAEEGEQASTPEEKIEAEAQPQAEEQEEDQDLWESSEKEDFFYMEEEQEEDAQTLDEAFAQAGEGDIKEPPEPSGEPDPKAEGTSPEKEVPPWEDQELQSYSVSEGEQQEDIEQSETESGEVDELSSPMAEQIDFDTGESTPPEDFESADEVLDSAAQPEVTFEETEPDAPALEESRASTAGTDQLGDQALETPEKSESAEPELLEEELEDTTPVALDEMLEGEQKADLPISEDDVAPPPEESEPEQAIQFDEESPFVARQETPAAVSIDDDIFEDDVDDDEFEEEYESQTEPESTSLDEVEGTVSRPDPDPDATLEAELPKEDKTDSEDVIQEEEVSPPIFTVDEVEPSEPVPEEQVLEDEQEPSPVITAAEQDQMESEPASAPEEPSPSPPLEEDQQITPEEAEPEIYEDASTTESTTEAEFEKSEDDKTLPDESTPLVDDSIEKQLQGLMKRRARKHAQKVTKKTDDELEEMEDLTEPEELAADETPPESEPVTEISAEPALEEQFASPAEVPDETTDGRDSSEEIETQRTDKTTTEEAQKSMNIDDLNDSEFDRLVTNLFEKHADSLSERIAQKIYNQIVENLISKFSQNLTDILLKKE